MPTKNIFASLLLLNIAVQTYTIFKNLLPLPKMKLKILRLQDFPKTYLSRKVIFYSRLSLPFYRRSPPSLTFFNLMLQSFNWRSTQRSLVLSHFYWGVGWLLGSNFQDKTTQRCVERRLNEYGIRLKKVNGEKQCSIFFWWKNGRDRWLFNLKTSYKSLVSVKFLISFLARGGGF